jgi:hypothetical protein
LGFESRVKWQQGISLISQASAIVTGENHEALPGCYRSRLQKMSCCLRVPLKKPDRRLHTARENSQQKTGPKESPVKTGINVVA